MRGATLVSLLLASGLASAQGRKPTVEVPVENSNYQIVILMKIGGKEARFALDSGSFEVRIQRSSAERLGLVSPLPAEIRDSGVQIDQSMAGEFEIGGVRFGKQPYMIKPMFMGADGKATSHADYDGIIGLDLLRKHAWGFDLVKNRIAVWKGGKLSPKDAAAWTGGSATTVPLTTEGKQDWYRLDGTLNRLPTSFVLDTGAPTLVVMGEKAETYGFSPLYSANLSFLESTRQGSLALGTEVGFPWRIQLTPIAATVSVLQFLTFAELRSDAVVGYDQFLNAKTVFDFPSLRLTTSPNAEIARWSRYLGSFGFRIGFSEGRPAALVRPGGPADKAGVKTGDLLEEIDGRPVSASLETQPPSDWKEKGDLTLRVRRGEDMMTIVVRL